MSAAACAKRILNQQTIAMLEWYIDYFPTEVPAAIATARAVDAEVEGASEKLVIAWMEEEKKLAGYLLSGKIEFSCLRELLIDYIERMRTLPLEFAAS